MTEATPRPSNSSPNRLGVNVFTAPAKSFIGERPRPFGEPLGWDPITSTLIFGEYDAVLVDTLTTVAEAEALAAWVALHNRNLATIYITHEHFDHFYGLSVLLRRSPRRQSDRDSADGGPDARGDGSGPVGSDVSAMVPRSAARAGDDSRALFR